MGSESAITIVGEQHEGKHLVIPPVTATIIKDSGYDTAGIDVNSPIPLVLLRERGIVMVNVAGGAERTIIQEVGEASFRQKLFLTEEELKLAKKTMVPEGISEEELVLMSDDMLAFIEECYWFRSYRTLLYPDDFCSHINVARITIDELGKQRGQFGLRGRRKPLVDNLDYQEEEKLVEGIVRAYQDRYQVPKDVRGVPVEDITFRGEGEQMAGSKCPMLACEHVFRDRNGIKILDREGKISGTKNVIVRLNEVVAHLTSHGICNTGTPSDWDQRYITLAEYLELYMKRNETVGLREIDLNGLLREIVLELARRIVSANRIEYQEDQFLRAFEKGLARSF